MDKQLKWLAKCHCLLPSSTWPVPALQLLFIYTFPLSDLPLFIRPPDFFPVYYSTCSPVPHLRSPELPSPFTQLQPGSAHHPSNYLKLPFSPVLSDHLLMFLWFSLFSCYQRVLSCYLYLPVFLLVCLSACQPICL